MQKKQPPNPLNVNDDNSSADIVEHIEFSAERKESSELKSQWASDELPEFAATPSHRLIYATVQRAFMDLARPEPHIRKDAIRWIFSNSKEPFSFLWAVEIMQVAFTPEEVRDLARNILKKYAENQQ